MTLSAKYGVRLTRNRNCFSPTGTSFTSVAATAVALRGAASISAISPKMSWSPNVPRSRLPSRISTLPRWMTKNSAAASPSLKMTSPALNSRNGALAPTKIPKSTGVSAMTRLQCCGPRLLQFHDGGRLQFYDRAAPQAKSDQAHVGQDFVELLCHLRRGRDQRAAVLVGLEHAEPLEHVLDRDRATLQRNAAKQWIEFQIERDGAVDVALGKRLVELRHQARRHVARRDHHAAAADAEHRQSRQLEPGKNPEIAAEPRQRAGDEADIGVGVLQAGKMRHFILDRGERI